MRAETIAPFTFSPAGLARPEESNPGLYHQLNDPPDPIWSGRGELSRSLAVVISKLAPFRYDLFGVSIIIALTV